MNDIKHLKQHLISHPGRILGLDIGEKTIGVTGLLLNATMATLAQHDIMPEYLGRMEGKDE